MRRIGKQQKNGIDVEMSECEAALLAEADLNRQENLVSENDVDPMEGEQTWPTDEEIAEAAADAGMYSNIIADFTLIFIYQHMQL